MICDGRELRLQRLLLRVVILLYSTRNFVLNFVFYLSIHHNEKVSDFEEDTAVDADVDVDVAAIEIDDTDEGRLETLRDWSVQETWRRKHYR